MNTPQRNLNLRGFWTGIAALIILMLFVFSSTLITLYTDYLWFKSMHYSGVFMTRIGASVELAVIAIGIALVVLVVNWNILPHRFAPKDSFKSRVPIRTQGSNQVTVKEVAYSTRPIRFLFTVAAVILGIVLGTSFGGLWQKFLLASEGGAFNLTDPIFNKDIGFYIFQLPWYEALLLSCQILIVLTGIGVASRYILFGQIKSRPAMAHLSTLGAIWMLLMGVERLLARFTLLQSKLGVVLGAGYTDVNARMPLFVIEAIVFFAAAGILIVNIFARRWKPLIFVGIAWVTASVVGAIYPAIIQRFVVEPNESVAERPYIEHNIQYTRYAYNLENIQEQSYTADGGITKEDLENNAEMLNNVRLWDYRPLLRTYSQLQEIRLYYTFNGVDIDRYIIDGKLRQVMLSVRELNVDELNAEAQTWVNRHLIYTHGFGLTLSPASEVTPEGLPQLLVRDIPPVSSVPELNIAQPQIYFGESGDEYIVTGTSEQEFNYSQGDNNSYTRYVGPDGVQMGGFINRLLFALRFSDSNIFFSSALNRDSRIHFYRTVRERTRKIAPMLWFDDDAYPVIAATDVATGSAAGRIVWLLDAYTWTDHFPYAEATKVQDIGDINYARNSVKVSIDAYTGEVTFYLLDPNDPIAAAYARIFPELFRPIEEMPQVLRDHWRYPEALFRVQTQMYATYHMRDPQVFYNREDLWDFPRDIIETMQGPMEPYYVLMQTPGSESLEFVLIRPYVPNGKQNMVAWLYADCDGEDYGQMEAFKLPKDRLIYGPQQIEARVNQDTTISQQLTLWDQRGSQILRGNLLVIPIKDTFLYIEPLYLEAETAGQLPEFKRIIAAYNERVVMEPTLDKALTQLLLGSEEYTGGETGFGEGTDSGTPTSPETNLETLAQQALDHYQAGQTCLEQGNWTCYGQEQAAMEEILRIMAGRPK
ncbi:MAG: UPF0182 family protein [Anaerolineae bacterium]|nr:UPF0182 family protein [Anaerolineae bacterium]